MNYIKLIDKKNGKILAFMGTEPGSAKEMSLIEKALDLDLKLEPATEEEFSLFEGTVIFEE